jgi:hypothetical protein
MGFRLPDAVLRFADGRFDFNPAFNSGVSLQDAEAGRFSVWDRKGPEIQFSYSPWGDSHAMAALPALDYICNEYSVRAFAATHSQTPPLLDYVPEGSFSYSLKGDAPAFGEAVIRFIRAHHIPNVILIARWQGYKAGQSPEFHSALTKTLSALQTSVANIWIMQQVPNFSWGRSKSFGSCRPFQKGCGKTDLAIEFLLRTDCQTFDLGAGGA